MTEKYSNTFSLISPAILDSTFVATKADLSPDERLMHWSSWGMTTRREL